MANETTSSTLSELYTEIIQEAIFNFQETSVMRPLLRLTISQDKANKSQFLYIQLSVRRK